MAQLRDAKTGELLAEADPAALVAAVAKAGLRGGVIPPNGKPGRLDVTYDDVGLGFDPDATLEAHEATLAGRKAEVGELAKTASRNLKDARKRLDG